MKWIAVLALAVPAVWAAPSANPEPQPGDVCDLCKSVVEQMKDNQTIAQVEETLDKGCQLVPHFLFDPCKQFVGQLKEQIEEFAQADPEESCKQLGLCPAEPEPTTPPQPVPAAVPANGFACEACKWGWEAIEKSGPTPEAVKEQLETMCSMVPDELKDQCEQAVTQIVDQYREGLKQTPQQACEQLQLCDPEPTTTTATTATSTSTSTTAGPAPTTASNHAIINFIKSTGKRLQLQQGRQ